MSTTELGDGELTVAVIIGGHHFDAHAVVNTFRSIPDITCYPQDLATFVHDMGNRQQEYDTVVFYNFHGHGNYADLHDEMYWKAAESIQELGNRGQGIVALHHGIAAFPGLDEWEAVTGLDGTSLTGSYFDQSYRITPVCEDHYITDGLSSFTITGETYEMDEPDSSSTTLLETDHENGMNSVAWSRDYRKARVFCFQCGHGERALSDPTFRAILHRGIKWTANITENGSVALDSFDQDQAD